MKETWDIGSTRRPPTPEHQKKTARTSNKAVKEIFAEPSGSMEIKDNKYHLKHIKVFVIKMDKEHREDNGQRPMETSQTC